jgi:hypothetical protein
MQTIIHVDIEESRRVLRNPGRAMDKQGGGSSTESGDPGTPSKQGRSRVQ